MKQQDEFKHPQVPENTSGPAHPGHPTDASVIQAQDHQNYDTVIQQNQQIKALKKENATLKEQLGQ